MSASSIRAGRAYVELFTKDSQMVRGLNKAQRRFTSFGKSVAGIGAGVLGLGAAAAAPFFGAIAAASELEETMNKFNVVFGENSKIVKAWGDDYAKQVGRSKQQVADFMASNQDLLVPMGFEEGSATEMSKQISMLSVDLASFNNKADADVLRDLQAALTGSGEVMKKYGVIVSQTAVNQELMNQNIDPKKATEAAKVQARMNIIMRGTTAAQGDAIRSAGSWANQKKRLAALIKDTAASVGSKLLPILTPYLTKAGNVVAMTGKWIEANTGAVQTGLKVVGVVMAAGAAFLVAGGLIIGFGTVLGGLASVVSFVGTGLSAMIGLLGFIVSPVGLVIAAVVGLGYAFFTMTDAGAQTLSWLASQFGVFRDIAVSAFGGISNALSSGNLALAGQIAMLGLKAAWLQGTRSLSNLWTNLTTTIFNTLSFAFANVQSAFFTMVGALSKHWSSFSATFQKGWTSTQNSISKQMVKVMAYFDSSIDADDAMLFLDEQQAGRVQAIDGKRDADIKAADAQTKANVDRVNSEAGKTAEARNQAANKSIAETEAGVQKARDELNEAVAKANAAKNESDEEAAAKIGSNAPVRKAAAAASGVAKTVEATARNTALDARSSAGISAVIAATSGGSSKEDKTLTELEGQTSLLNKIANATEAGSKSPLIELAAEAV